MNDEIKIEKDMKPKLIGETWRKYPTETSKQKTTYGLFQCQYCGKEFEAMTKGIKSGNTRSCGCLYNGQPTHGLASHRFYKTWTGVIHRCTNHKSPSYKYYGGRGITVCEEWLDVRNFIEWAEATHPNIEGMSLDRIDNDKGYSPDNCRWANKTLQSVNQRISSSNTSGFTGVSYNITIKKYIAYLTINNTRKYIGAFKTIEEAVEARDIYIIENSLPHKLSTD